MHPIAFATSEHHVPLLSKKCLSGESGSLRLYVSHPSRAHVPTADKNGRVWGGTAMTFVTTREALETLLPEREEGLMEIRTQDTQVSLGRDGRELTINQSPDAEPQDISERVIYRDSFDAKCMIALMQALDGLPAITVLQAVCFDVRDHDTASVRGATSGTAQEWISGEEFLRNHPYGILLKPESYAVLPKIISTVNGKPLYGMLTAP